METKLQFAEEVHLIWIIEPLFVVDGTLYESSSEVDGVVSINDIDKVEIQKGWCSYGMKGANGVIIITTIKK